VIRQALPAAALALGLCAGPVLGQQSVAQCTAMVEGVQALGDMPLTVQEFTTEGEWCVATDLRAGPQDTEGGFALAVKRFAWRGTGLESLAEGLPPRALDLDVRGLHMLPQTGDPLLSWMLAAQARANGTDGTLSVRWDSLTGQISLTALEIDFPGDNAVSATATLTGADLSSQDAIVASLGRMAVTQMTLSVTTHGLFESFLLFPLAQVVLAGAEPQAEAEEVKRVARSFATDLPPSSFDAATIAALDHLVADLPNPAGRIVLTVTAPEGFGPARLMSVVAMGLERAGGIESVLDGVRVGVAYHAETEAPE